MRPEPGIANAAGNGIIPYLVLLRKGLAMRRELLPVPAVSYTAISPLPAETGGIFSVALSFPRNLVRGILLEGGLPALWSPDFPPRPSGRKNGAAACLQSRMSI